MDSNMFSQRFCADNRDPDRILTDPVISQWTLTVSLTIDLTQAYAANEQSFISLFQKNLLYGLNCRWTKTKTLICLEEGASSLHLSHLKRACRMLIHLICLTLEHLVSFNAKG